MPDCVAIIPARFASKRFPGKPLVPVADKPLILHVLERAKSIPSVGKVLVATDHQLIAETVRKNGGEAVMTPENLKSGSDRAGFVAKELKASIIVNLQGDEPLIDIDGVEAAINFLRKNREIPAATLGAVLRDEDTWKNPNVVKVLTDNNGKALYFSRRPIPFFRDGIFSPISCLQQHVGVYIFQKDFLLQFIRFKMTHLEQAEKLEQLRILENGFPIQVIPANSVSPGVDTPEDVAKIEKIIRK